MRAVAALLLLSGFAAAQQPPRQLPPEVTESPESGNLVRFEPELLAVKRAEARCQLWAGNRMLKDFGPNEAEAREALRLVRDMRFNQYGTIPGSVPVFEFWLCDGAPAKGTLAVRNVIPFNGAAVQLEDVGGAWVVRDDRTMLYNFGARKEAAVQALAVIKKYGFNQLGVIGIPSPLMTYLAVDSYGRAPQGKAPPPTKEIAFQISQQGIVLPEIGYAGSRQPLEPRKLDVAKMGYNWAIVHDKDVLGNFGPNMNDARSALRILQDARVTEICRIGRSGFPIYLCNGQAPRQAGLGFNNQRIRPAAMKVQVVNNIFCLTEEGRIVFEFGSDQADAELVLKVLKHFQFNQISPMGDMRLLLKSR